MKKWWKVCLLMLFVAMLPGCKKTSEPESDEKIRLAFIVKDLEHYWFQQEKEGMESKCKELGIEVNCFDAYYDDQRCMELVKQIIEEEYDGLMICTTNQELGPKIGELCEKAEIPVVTLDDSMKDKNGRSFPLISMAYKEVVAIGGVALAKKAEELGFPEENERLRVLEMDVPGLSVFRERLDGYEEVIFPLLHLSDEQVVSIAGETGMYADNYEKAKEYFQKNPPDVGLYWLICGVNDDCALALMHVLLEFGVPEEQVIACGLGGYELSVREFEQKSPYYITVMTQPDVEGARAVEMLYDYLKEGTEIDNVVTLGGAVATCDNYLIYFSSKETEGNK